MADSVEFTFEGRTFFARPGQTIAAALLVQGVRTLRRTRGQGQPRGLFCGIGACHDCLVDVNGEAAQRACLRVVAPGDDVRASGSTGQIR